MAGPVIVIGCALAVSVFAVGIGSWTCGPIPRLYLFVCVWCDRRVSEPALPSVQVRRVGGQAAGGGAGGLAAPHGGHHRLPPLHGGGRSAVTDRRAAAVTSYRPGQHPADPGPSGQELPARRARPGPARHRL